MIHFNSTRISCIPVFPSLSDSRLPTLASSTSPTNALRLSTPYTLLRLPTLDPRLTDHSRHPHPHSKLVMFDFRAYSRHSDATLHTGTPFSLLPFLLSLSLYHRLPLCIDDRTLPPSTSCRHPHSRSINVEYLGVWCIRPPPGKPGPHLRRPRR